MSKTNKSPSSTDAEVPEISAMIDMSTDPKNADPLFQHLSRTFTTRELVQLKLVSKMLATLISKNVGLTTKAQCEDDTKDWYFPVRVMVHPSKRLQRQNSWSSWNDWTWSGIHHSSGQINRLPDLPCFHSKSLNHLYHPRFPGVGCCNPQLRYLVASTGGLVLFTDKVETYNWRPLLVHNPLTKEWRVLPESNCRDVGLQSWDYIDAQYHIVMDQKANCYKVILTFTTCLCVYNSTSNSWSSQAFLEPIPWARHRRFLPFMTTASVVVDGKVFYAQLEVGRNDMPLRRDVSNTEIRNYGHVKVFEIDEEAGAWKQPIRYALRNYFADDLQNPDHDYGFRFNAFAFKIVECMDGLYAIIPAKYDNERTMEVGITASNDLNDEAPLCFRYLLLQFYVLRLQGVGLVLGHILTQVPCDPYTREIPIHRRFNGLAYMDDTISPNNCQWHIGGKGWFHCSSRGA